MSRFTGEEFERAFQQVYESEQPLFPECKVFLRNILTNSIESVYATISKMLDENKDEMNKCLKTIIEHDNIVDLINFIENINAPSATIDTISTYVLGYEELPIVKVCLRMFQNQAQGLQRAPPASAHPPRSTITKPSSAKPTSTRPSAIFKKHAITPPSAIFKKTAITPASARPSAHPTTSFAYHKKNLERFRTNAASVPPGTSHTLSPGVDLGGGSRRRRSSHRKRKSYRKSKRVRHTPRKQTRRHRHRRSRHRC